MHLLGNWKQVTKKEEIIFPGAVIWTPKVITIYSTCLLLIEQIYIYGWKKFGQQGNIGFLVKQIEQTK